MGIDFKGLPRAGKAPKRKKTCKGWVEKSRPKSNHKGEKMVMGGGKKEVERKRSHENQAP